MSAKTGIELIAEKRKNIIYTDCKLLNIGLYVDRARFTLEYGRLDRRVDDAVFYLTEAGALIAAEIDRINNLYK